MKGRKFSQVDGKIMENNKVLVDTRGYHCPINMAMVSRKVNGIETGTELEVWYDDGGMTRDLEEWSRETGNRILKMRIHSTITSVHTAEHI